MSGMWDYEIKLFRKVKFMDGYTSKFIIRSTVPIKFPNFLELASELGGNAFSVMLVQTGVRKKWVFSFRFPFLRREHIQIYEFMKEKQNV